MKKITFSNIDEFTNQQIFDQVAVHLLTQLEKAFADDTCCLRTVNNTTCAVGSLIDFKNCKTIGVIHGGVTSAIKASGLHEETSLRKEVLNLLFDLQGIHDLATVGNWHDELLNLAVKLKFNTRAVNKLCKPVAVKIPTDKSIENIKIECQIYKGEEQLIAKL